MGNASQFDSYEKVIATKEIQSIIAKYRFLNISDEIYKNLITKIIMYTKDSYRKDNYIHYIGALLNRKIRKYINFTLKSEEKAVVMISNFILFNFKSVNCYEDAIYNVSLMGKYFVSSSQNIIIELIRKNMIFNDNIKTIYEKNKKAIEKTGLEKLFDDSFSKMVVSIYCMINNISVGTIENNIDLSDADLTDDFRLYMLEINALPVASYEDNIRLAKLAQAGDMEARNKMIESNLRLIIRVAREYYCDNLSFMDLMQEGIFGLVRAIELYNPDYGFAFSTYANVWIRQAIIRAISDKGRHVRIPAYMLEKMGKFVQVKGKLRSKLNREPEISEIAEEMNISEEKAIFISTLFVENVSLNKLVSNENSNCEIGDLVPDENTSVEEDAIKLKLDELIEVIRPYLSDRELDILLLRTGGINGEIWTLGKIGEKYHLTRERVRQIEENALKKIRKKCRNILIDYVPDSPKILGFK